MKTFYWSRIPSKFVNKLTGEGLKLPSSLSNGPTFTGTVREWYECLVETLIDLSQTCEKSGLCDTRAMLFVTASPDVATILECSVLFKPNFSPRPIVCENCAKELTQEALGTVSNRFIVTIDRNLPRNVMMLGDYGQVKVLDYDMGFESLTSNEP